MVARRASAVGGHNQGRAGIQRQRGAVDVQVEQERTAGCAAFGFPDRHPDLGCPVRTDGPVEQGEAQQHGHLGATTLPPAPWPAEMVTPAISGCLLVAR